MGDIIVFKNPQNDLVSLKRIKKIKFDHIFLVGDNKKESTDSRQFGWVNKKDTIGKVIAS